MTPFLEKLIELLRSWWGLIVPWAILGDDQHGIMRRLGVTRGRMARGWNWKWPLIEEAKTVTATLESMVLREQSLTTKDGRQVTLRVVITYHIVDPYTWIVAVDDGESVMNDAGCLAVSSLVSKHSADYVLCEAEFRKKLARAVRKRAKKWGVRIDAVGLADRTAAPTYRLMGIK